MDVAAVSTEWEDGCHVDVAAVSTEWEDGCHVDVPEWGRFNRSGGEMLLRGRPPARAASLPVHLP